MNNLMNVVHPDDSDALKDLKTMKVVYDMNGVSEPKKMIVMLKAII